MAHHTVESGAITELVSELQKATEYVGELITSAQAAAEHVSTQWSGDANAQFRELHAEWTQGAATMADGASRIAARASICAQNYDGVADHVKGLWG
ncbi:WXG100 family type VII secretion target [Frondihabitans sp. PAMC 28766]|uniref:WXG100 family type VII secretion target n=1 Tax=Frondihabitans sp. PAMC 28766 TaxID=1795630 RepID=UPI0012FFB93D|nr:WXG100 family type VII secretion target [Frondihabitans sp. PAMC 28766]